ncbi:Protein of unknown function [Amycolatopsis arida]|uniref:DUF3040 domain-containing protein n=1 Tax=Amycolatopsis arida TaxID=587909 RepID=A0A1I5MDD0_9PSEU|nr:DUF3040 domain-containing protein [Amycolatopsis arida]TDX94055.1 Protein of unknown function (DUF3040) [Amycolatopsis arida]SFP07533.1 Protein of unknown function [Amycolatopsis arida]
MVLDREHRQLRGIERGLERADPRLAERLGDGTVSWAARDHPVLAAGLDLAGGLLVVAALLTDVVLVGIACVVLMVAACMHCTHHGRAHARRRERPRPSTE